MAEPDITPLLNELERGDEDGLDRLVGRIYPTFRPIALAHLHNHQTNHTLHSRDLVQEAFLQLVHCDSLSRDGRAHFLNAAARTMRRVVIEHAGARPPGQRSSETLTIAGAELAAEVSLERLLAINDALDRLVHEHPRWVRIVEARFFAGLSIEETAFALGISRRTVLNEWRLARAWLLHELDG